MSLDGQLRRTNRNMIAFDLLLGSSALIAPSQTLRVLGHEEPSDDAKELFRRCGPIWLTFAAAHLVAYRRNRPKDWWALSWLRGTELATDIVWSRSRALLPAGRPCRALVRRTQQPGDDARLRLPVRDGGVEVPLRQHSLSCCTP